MWFGKFLRGIWCKMKEIENNEIVRKYVIVYFSQLYKLIKEGKEGPFEFVIDIKESESKYKELKSKESNEQEILNKKGNEIDDYFNLIKELTNAEIYYKYVQELLKRPEYIINLTREEIKNYLKFNPIIKEPIDLKIKNAPLFKIKDLLFGYNNIGKLVEATGFIRSKSTSPKTKENGNEIYRDILIVADIYDNNIPDELQVIHAELPEKFNNYFNEHEEVDVVGILKIKRKDDKSNEGYYYIDIINIYKG